MVSYDEAERNASRHKADNCRPEWIIEMSSTIQQVFCREGVYMFARAFGDAFDCAYGGAGPSHCGLHMGCEYFCFLSMLTSSGMKLFWK